MKKGIIFNCCMAASIALVVNLAPTVVQAACNYSYPDTSSYTTSKSAACRAFGGFEYSSSSSLGGYRYTCLSFCSSSAQKDISECCCEHFGGTWSGVRCLEMSTSANYPTTGTGDPFTDYPSSGSDYHTPATTTTATPATTETTTTATPATTESTTTATPETTTETETSTTATPATTESTTTATPETTTETETSTTATPATTESTTTATPATTDTYTTDDGGGALTTTPAQTTTTLTPDTTSPIIESTTPAITTPETTSPATTSPETTTPPETTSTCEEILPET